VDFLISRIKSPISREHAKPLSARLEIMKWERLLENAKLANETKVWVRLIRGSEIMRNQPTDHVRTCLIAISRWSVGVDRI
jgi:hypothetical protein